MTGAQWNCSILARRCRNPRICISNPPNISVCSHNTSELPENHRTFVVLTMDDVIILSIEEVSEDLDNAVYTIKCPFFMSCSELAVDVVEKNFQLSVAHIGKSACYGDHIRCQLLSITRMSSVCLFVRLPGCLLLTLCSGWLLCISLLYSVCHGCCSLSILLF